LRVRPAGEQQGPSLKPQLLERAFALPTVHRLFAQAR
jgi:hypothetical protein